MKNEPTPNDKEEFIRIYKEKIIREGSDKLLEFLEKSADCCGTR